MNYRHTYHAGNFADVIKHTILISLITSLTKKESPICVIDTHAGTGYYDLFSEWAAKNKEYMGGIEKIIQQDNPPGIIKLYLDCVHKINRQLSQSQYSSIRYYPGSPMIARYLARPHDRVIACELQVDEYKSLREAFAGDKQVAVHHLDGFLGLKAFLPPHEKRGIILIDPPYENPDEFGHLARVLPSTLKRFESGVYAIWYPIKDKNQTDHFYRAIKENINAPVLAIELTIYPDLPNHLNGCGMVIINPPWQFDQTINHLLPWLWKSLTINDQGYYRAYPLK